MAFTQTDRQTDRQTGRRAGRQADAYIHTETDRYIHTNGPTDRPTDRQADRRRRFCIHKNKMVELRDRCLHVLTIMIILPPRAVMVFVFYQDFVQNVS